MAGIPAFCKQCGTLSLQRNLFAAGREGTRITMVGSRITCPHCQGMADILDGVFELSGDTFSLISGPNFTKKMLLHFSDLIDQAARKEIGQDELERRAGEIDPRLGRAVADIRKRSPHALGILVLICLLLQRCSFNINADINVNDIWNDLAGEMEVSELYVPRKSKGDAEYPPKDETSPNSYSSSNRAHKEDRTVPDDDYPRAPRPRPQGMEPS